ncbi:efflux RND transporter permease subunit, partial [Bacillus subtilis]|uniref:efflux RND transporter permease subunit n=2 Tax=Bacillales TaxID=1385 RepID=UPI003F7C9ACB
LGLTEDTVNGIVQGSSVRVPLGLFELDKAQKAVVVDGNIIDLDDLKNLAIPVVPSGAGAGSGSATAPQGANAQAGGAAQGSAQGADQVAGQTAGGNASVGSTSGAANAPGIPTVKLSEIAKIEVIGQAESISRTDGKESIGISIVKSNDANTVDVVKAVKDKAEELQTQFKNAELTVLLDQGKPIQDSVNTMLFKAMFGALFAILIILL